MICATRLALALWLVFGALVVPLAAYALASYGRVERWQAALCRLDDPTITTRDLHLDGLRSYAVIATIATSTGGTNRTVQIRFPSPPATLDLADEPSVLHWEATTRSTGQAVPCLVDYSSGTAAIGNRRFATRWTVLTAVGVAAMASVLLSCLCWPARMWLLCCQCSEQPLDMTHAVVAAPPPPVPRRPPRARVPQGSAEDVV